MKSFLQEIRRAAVATLLLIVVCCGLYPAVVTLAARTFFPNQAGGSLLRDTNGTVRGSRLLGQSFTGDRYFHPRPSAAGAGYDATASSGSNLGPTSARLRDLIRERLAAYRQTNGLVADAPVPADAVTASASGLDPHISVANARLQADRIARARGLAVSQIRDRIEEHTGGAGSRFLGDPGVNVVTLNAALDR